MKRLCQAGETQQTKPDPRTVASCPAAFPPRAKPCGRGSPGHGPPPCARDGESRDACAVAPAPPSFGELWSSARVSGGAGPAALGFSHSDRRAGGSGESGAAPRGSGETAAGRWRPRVGGVLGVGVTAEGAGLGVGTRGGPSAALFPLQLRAVGLAEPPGFCPRRWEGSLSFPALPSSF